MARKYKGSEEWKKFGFEPTVTDVTGSLEGAMKSDPNGNWFPRHILQDFAEAESDRDYVEDMLHLLVKALESWWRLPNNMRKLSDIEPLIITALDIKDEMDKNHV